MARYLVLGVVLLVVCRPSGLSAAAEEVNHCHDKQAWEPWNETVAKSPDDLDLQFLHALWLGLCQKVERQEITVPQATELFERARTRLMEQRKTDQDKAAEAPL
jgi:hypothetical protein